MWIPRALLLAYLVYADVRFLRDPTHGTIFSGITLGFHEMGHVVFAWAPRFIAVVMGSVFQIAVPIVVIILFYRQPDFFGVKDNPKATFKTTKVEKTEKGYQITGDLTMIGKTKPVTFPASVTLAPDAVLLATAFTIDRTDWGMKYGQGMIDDKVTIKVAMTAKK